MADEHRDPSGNTEAFRAFVRREDAEPSHPKSRLPLAIAAGVLALLIVIVVGVMALS